MFLKIYTNEQVSECAHTQKQQDRQVMVEREKPAEPEWFHKGPSSACELPLPLHNSSNLGSHKWK